jgi:manganese transport protein
MTKLQGSEPWYIAMGILGATVMPHNLYLHSSVVQTRLIGHSVAAKREAIQLSGVDTTLSLTLAFAVNAAILILAGTAFHNPSLPPVSGIEDAYQLLTPMVGGSVAAILFAIALLASGQSATFTGTIAGQIVMEGFMKWKIPCWQRRILTRALALAPALAGVILLGDHSVNKMLVLSQVVLSLQLPFAIFPLLRFASSQNLMGVLRISGTMKFVGWTLFFIITAANLAMLIKQFY